MIPGNRSGAHWCRTVRAPSVGAPLAPCADGRRTDSGEKIKPRRPLWSVSVTEASLTSGGKKERLAAAYPFFLAPRSLRKRRIVLRYKYMYREIYMSSLCSGLSKSFDARTACLRTPRPSVYLEGIVMSKKNNVESIVSFSRRVLAATGVELEEIPEGDGQDLLSGAVLARRGDVYVVTDGAPAGVDEDGTEWWALVPSSFRRVTL